MKKLLLSAVFVAPFLFSCDDDDPAQQMDYLIFGHFHGECLGEHCVETFKLTDTELYEDMTDQYRGENKNFFVLDAAQFEKVKTLKSKVPAALLSSPDGVFGTPDVADGGGIYVEVRVNGQTHAWEIDKTRSNIPEYLIPFVNEIESSIAAINQ